MRFRSRTTGELITDHCIILRMEKKAHGCEVGTRSGRPNGSRKRSKSYLARKQLEPGNTLYGGTRGPSIYWPEHPLANNGKMVSLHKLNIWQDSEFRSDLIDRIKSAYAMEPLSSILGGPSFVSFSKRDGYTRLYWKNHPLADSHRVVLEHQLIVWQLSGYDEYILKLLAVGRAMVHHLNGRRDDNHPGNLEFRLKSNHVFGVGESDMIITLKGLGYTVAPP